MREKIKRWGLMSIIFLVPFTLSYLVYLNASARKPTCKTVDSYQQAQDYIKLYESDPEKYKKYKELDRDKDGTACENIKE